MNASPRPLLAIGIHWVRGELDQSIARARALIDHHAESGGDPLQLQQAYVELHQVRGTAAMIECHGLATVAAEMTAGLQDLMHQRIAEPEALYAALLGASVQLSDYIHALADGLPDCALVLQPAINELRLSRGRPVLTESELFVAQMQALGVTLPLPVDAAAQPGGAQRQARRLMALFQASLVAWVRGGADAQTGAARAGKIAEQIAQDATQPAVHQLWRVAAASIEAYLGRAITNALELKRLFGRLAAQLKLLAEAGEDAAAAQAGDLAFQLLFMIGRSSAQGARVRALRRAFELDRYLPTVATLEQMRRRIHGANTALLAKVASEIRSEFVRVKDQIDLMVRTGDETGQRSAAVADSLTEIGRTLSALGLLRLQEVILRQVQRLREASADGAQPALLMDLATAILRVENDLEDALFRQMQLADAAARELSEDVPAPRDLAEGRDALYREFLVNLARIKAAVDAYLRHGNESDLPACAALLQEIASGFEVLAQPQAAELCCRLSRPLAAPAYTRLREDSAYADRYADAVAAVEYYIEAQRSRLPGAERILADLIARTERLEQRDAAAAPALDDTADKAAGEAAEVPPRTERVAVAAPETLQPTELAAGADPEIREIFLEEAAEVGATLDAAFAAWSRDPKDRDALTTLRRAFHTLKGSGRTVGATEIGEFGWAIENMLNRCLDGSVAVTPGIVETVGRARAAAGTDRRISRGARHRRAQELATVIEHAREYAAGRTPVVATEPDIAQVFREDIGEKLAAVERWLAEHPEPEAEVAAEVVRAFHTLRGAARVVDAQALSELAGALEAYLDALVEAQRPLDAQGLALLREAVPLLQRWVGEVGSTAVVRQDAGPLLQRIEALHAELPKAAAQASAERQLVEIFASEAFELVSKIEDQVRGWQQSPESQRAAVELRMLSHTLLGAAQMSSCPAVAKVAQALNRSVDGAAARGIVPDAAAFALLLDLCEGLFGYLDRFREHRLADDDEGWTDRVNALGWAREAEAAAPAAAPSGEVPAATEPQAPTELPELSLDGFDAALDLPAPQATLAADAPPVADTAIEPSLDEPAPPSAEPAAAATDGEDAERIVEMPPDEAAQGPCDPELIAIFRAEAEELVESLDQSLAALERDPRQFAPLAEIKRALHTFKGSARVSGLHTLGEVAHRLESLFEDLEVGAVTADTHFFARTHNVVDGLHLALDDLRRGVIPEPLNLLDELSQPLAPAPAAAASEAPLATPPPVAPLPPPMAPVTLPSAAAASLPDDFDIDLAQTFAAEAEELMEILEAALPRWQALPGDFSPARDMLRVLHTLKGGARMAGLPVLGDAAHELESLIEGLEYAGELDAGALRVVEGAVAELRRYTDHLQRGQYAALITATDEAAQAPAAASALDTGAPAVVDGPAAEDVAEEAASQGLWDPQLFWRPEEDLEGLAAQRRETARVPVEALERMLNEAGEISIHRSRMDEHNAAIQAQLDDMAQAIQRVRDQLRQLDIETEAQITARGFNQAEGADRYAGEFDPLEMDRYTRMQELSRALNESVGDLAAVHAALDRLASEATTILLQQGRINTEIQQGLMRTLMVPFSRQVARLQRVVQQTANEHGKRVEFVVDGAEAELDRNVLERMTAPLEHLLRNAVIHGIETPEQRDGAGKPQTGRLRLSLWREASQLFMELADDGRGLDLDAIRQTAIRRGLIPADAEISDDEAAQFIFLPGFSTARQLTRDAGRGVGMDVVAAEVKQLGGNLELASEPGKGTRFKIRLPLTLALSQSLLIGVGHEIYATPLPSIEGITRIARDQLDAYLAEDGPELEYGGQRYRVRHLADLVGMPREAASDAKTAHAVLVRMPEGIGGSERHVAVVVDRLIGSREIVSKAVGPQISSIPGISGATILADGRVVLILDIAALVQDRTRRVLRTQMAERSGGEAPLAAQRDTIMVVDDSITIRRVTERLLAKHGFAVVTAKDGLDAMAQLATERPAAILLDIEMPRADGFEVATFVRNTSAIARTPILMITSRSGDKHRERAAAIGVDRYLIKPYQEDQLLGELRAVLAERR
ncbi:hybrid sensor histidine kinase/response regulator [Sinimarinibacterium thermocellulolyticum]|uniref:histidine kinase n=1 Tax=Sinimarinibacterium thermocellulolyticum TaxID=3170016 RepID=A0ABV2ABC2_9GAMM